MEVRNLKNNSEGIYKYSFNLTFSFFRYNNFLEVNPVDNIDKIQDGTSKYP